MMCRQQQHHENHRRTLCTLSTTDYHAVSSLAVPFPSPTPSVPPVTITSHVVRSIAVHPPLPNRSQIVKTTSTSTRICLSDSIIGRCKPRDRRPMIHGGPVNGIILSVDPKSLGTSSSGELSQALKYGWQICTSIALWPGVEGFRQ